MAKIVSLLVKVGAVVFILALPQDYATQLQLLGGIYPASARDPTRLYTRWRNASALLVGWAGACNRHLYRSDARIRHLGLSLVGVRRDTAWIRGALFGAREFPARYRTHAALQPLATD